MPKSKQPAARARTVEEDVPADVVGARADALFRAAVECVRQRDRYAMLVEGGFEEHEQQAALAIACCADDCLSRMVELYGAAAAHDTAHSTDGWWRRANALWLASREYQSHHRDCDSAAARFTKHDSSRLATLAVEYDLEASALLALRMAVDAYRKERPAAELTRTKSSAA